MGEAKRRRQKDPDYGTYRVAIKKSEVSSNYLVMLNDYLFDSTVSEEEAQRVSQWLEIELAARPINHRFLTNPQQVEHWFFESDRISEYPETTAEIKVLNRADNSEERQLITVSVQDLLNTRQRIYQ